MGSDEATALATYGDISVWDVSLITDMTSLFQDKNFFNSDISGGMSPMQQVWIHVCWSVKF